jgi:hypothetical protein
MRSIRRWLRSLFAVSLAVLGAQAAAQDQVAHSKYLVTVMGCGDCHTAGAFLGKPDMAHMLASGDVAFEVPGNLQFRWRRMLAEHHDHVAGAVTNFVCW